MTEKNEVEERIERAVAAVNIYDLGHCDCGNVDVEEVIRELAQKGFLSGYTKSPQVDGVVEWALQHETGYVIQPLSVGEARAHADTDYRLVSRTVTPWKPEETA